MLVYFQFCEIVLPFLNSQIKQSEFCGLTALALPYKNMKNRQKWLQHLLMFKPANHLSVIHGKKLV